ncbi:MAG: hypothetical protein CMP48_20630 [Rickettsiales bacterium]|nr:hypothetical protein [Rickettsiales bacterium]
MIKSGSTILLVSPESWDHMWVSKHHYAVHLANRGYQVIFLNPPGSRWGLHQTEFQNLRILDYPGFVKGVRKMPGSLSKYFVNKVFKRITASVGTAVDIIWQFDSTTFFDFNYLGNGVTKFLHVVDLNQTTNIGRLAGSADICFYCSEPIGQILKKYNDRCYFINHGYSTFQSDNYKFDWQHEINIGYAGNLDIKYIDWETIRQSIIKHPGIGFQFAGHCADPDKLEFFEQCPNASWVGPLPKERLYSFYNQVDGLLICYDVEHHKDQLANPHKLLEYLGSGKPIIASHTIQYETVDNDVICMVYQHRQWHEKFGEFIQSLKHLSHKIYSQKRIDLAMMNTYEKHISHIEGLMNE